MQGEKVSLGGGVVLSCFASAQVQSEVRGSAKTQSRARPFPEARVAALIGEEGRPVAVLHACLVAPPVLASRSP